MSLHSFLRTARHTRSRTLLPAYLLAVTLAVSACGGGGGGGGGSAPVSQAAAITTQPASQTVAAGQSVTFTVGATGDGLSYQWQRNGADIPGANAASYVLNNVQVADEGSRFTVVVRNAAGSTTSAAATLQVAGPRLSLLAGAIGGPGQMDGPVGRFREPRNIVVSPSSEIYVNDQALLRKITLASGGTSATVTTLPNDEGARWAVVPDAAGNRYENWTYAIYKLSPAGTRTLVAGSTKALGSADGPGSEARFGLVAGMAVDAGGTLYVADLKNATIRKISPAGVVTTLAGSAGISDSVDGTGPAARFLKPDALVLDKAGNVYVRDGDAVRKVTPAGVVTTLARITPPRRPDDDVMSGVQPTGGSTAFFGGLAVGADGSVYALSGNIRRISTSGEVTNFAGDPLAWSRMATMAQDAAGNMYVADPEKAAIYRVNTAGEIGVLAGLPDNAGSSDGLGAAARLQSGLDFYATEDPLVVDAQGNITLSERVQVRTISAAGAVSTLPLPVLGVSFRDTYVIPSPAFGNDLLVFSSGSGVLKRIDRNGNVKDTIATVTARGRVDGPKDLASMIDPMHFRVDPKGNIYFTDYERVALGYNTPALIPYRRKISPDGTIVTLTDAQSAGTGTGVWDRDGRLYFVGADGIRRRTPDGAESTIYPRPSAIAPADFSGPLAVDRSGNVYLGAGTVLYKFTPAGASIVAGSPGSIGVRLGAAPGSLNTITALAVGDDGTVYIRSENGILKLTQ